MVALGSAHELKNVFASRPIVELQTTQPVQAMAALDAMPEVEKTSIFGTAVHAVLRSADVSPDRLRAALESQGLAVSGLGQVTPSLEDVFLDVVERTEQAAQGGQAA
jgi:ABC-2 type transport system ATP-binding protein